MWALRLLTGPGAGQIFVLKAGKNRLGRSATCDFQVSVPGVSKEHLEIQVVGQKISVRDLQSSNGTFVNGVRVQAASLKSGDKLGVDRVIFDVIPAPSNVPQVLQKQPASPGPMVPYQAQVPGQPMSPGMMNQNYEAQSPAQAMSSAAPEDFKGRAERYFNDAFMPGIYRLVEVFEFRFVIMGFGAVFVFLVTLLSMFPMNQITSESVLTESRRRAQTVARVLANSNEKAIRSGDMSGYSADLVLKDEGISHIYILGKDGSIIAPPEMVGLQAKDLAGFVKTIKGQTKEFSAEISSGRIAASAPILSFDPELQQNVAKAHAVVVYDTETLKFDDGRALGLFVQMLAIALVLGSGLFYVMYKLIELPFLRLNEELDSAMREGRDHAQVDIKMPQLNSLMVGINSLLTRAQQGGGGSAAMSASTQDSEWVNMLQLFGYPAILISKDMQIVAVNAPFEALTGAQAHLVQGQVLAYLPDQALQKNIEELVRQSQNNTQQLHDDRLEISGHFFSLKCQAITVAGEARYFLIGVSPMEQAEGGAA